MPGPIRNRAAEITADFRGRWRPLVNALRLIMRAGVQPMAVFVLAYTALEAASGWLFIAVKHLIGPQPIGKDFPWRGRGGSTRISGRLACARNTRRGRG